MGWKLLILVLVCASACQSLELDRKVRKAAAIPTNYDVKDIEKMLEKIEKSKLSRSGHDEQEQLQPYHKDLQKVEAFKDEIYTMLDHPTSTPPINETLRHRIALAYTIHYVALSTKGSTYYDDYYKFVDEGYKQGLSSPVEDVGYIRSMQDEAEFQMRPTSDLIHELCSKSKDSSAIETCDMLVAFAIQMNPDVYESSADIVITAADVYDNFKPLLSEMRAAAESFTELAYLINNKEKLRKPILSLNDLYRKLIVFI